MKKKHYEQDILTSDSTPHCKENEVLKQIAYVNNGLMELKELEQFLLRFIVVEKSEVEKKILC